MSHRRAVRAAFRGAVSVLALLGVLALPSPGYAGMEVEASAQELSERADVIITAEVTSQRSFVRNDQNGKHIYTEVSMRPLESLKGTERAGNITVEVIGGTFEGWREEVSYSPVFQNGERAVLFLKANPYRLVAARQGRRTLRDGKFSIGGVRITPSDFVRALREHEARRSRGESGTLNSVIEAFGEAQSRAVRGAASFAEDTSRPPSESRVGSSHGPLDLGGGTIPREQLPAIQK